MATGLDDHGQETFARAMWLRIETLNAVSYFGEESDEAGRAAGMSGFWMGYFGFRAAPMGPVGSGVVEATFFNFAPAFVQRWVPEVWRRASPESLLERRSQAAAATLARFAPSIAEVAAEANSCLQLAIERSTTAGRPLFAANRRLSLPDDPVAALWQLCTTLREQRGDGHVATLTAAGLDGLEAHILIALEQGNSPEDLQRTRGWTPTDWAAAVQRCQAHGLVDDERQLSVAGRALRADIEATTDRLASAPWTECADGDRQRLLATLSLAAEAVSQSGVIRYPNPIGLPAIV